MRAVVLTAKGGPEVLVTQDVPDPVCGPAEILVDVVTSAVNRADLLQRRGLYPGPPAAHERMEANLNAGKIVLDVSPA